MMKLEDLPKYKYTGHDTKICPVCSKRIASSFPVIYFYEDRKIVQHKWCATCFDPLYAQAGQLISEGKLKTLIDPLTQLVRIALKGDYPPDTVVRGFSFSTHEQNLTLVVELVDD
jgi:hypothetical protein